METYGEELFLNFFYFFNCDPPTVPLQKNPTKSRCEIRRDTIGTLGIEASPLSGTRFGDFMMLGQCDAATDLDSVLKAHLYVWPTSNQKHFQLVGIFPGAKRPHEIYPILQDSKLF